MSLGGCALLGAICTVLMLVGWPYVLRFVPEITFVSTNIVVIIALVLFVLLAMICLVKKKSVASKVIFFLFVPLLGGVLFHYGNTNTLLFGAEWWKGALALGAAMLLLVVCMVIINAMDIDRHGFAYWLAIIFFIGIAIGLYFLIELWIGKEVAQLFSSCAMMGISFTSIMMSYFPE